MSAIKHLRVVCRHRHEVFKNCFRAGLYWQGLTHDLSKFSPCEFLVGAKYFQGSRSPNDAEREARGYSSAWMHHKGTNKHHIEFWTDYHPVTKHITPVKMPRKYVAEMFCDRIAACKIYQGKRYTDQSPIDYFELGRSRREIHQETSDQLEQLLTFLAQNGEKATFAYIKQWIKQQD